VNGICTISEWLSGRAQKEKQLKKIKEKEEIEKRYIEEKIEEKMEIAEKNYREMKSFRKVGEKFNFLGVEMTVVDVWQYLHGTSCMNAKYVDKNGVIREMSFRQKDLPLLRSENGA